MQIQCGFLPAPPLPLPPPPAPPLRQAAARFYVEGDGRGQLSSSLPCTTDPDGDLWTVFNGVNAPPDVGAGPPSEVRKFTPDGRLLLSFGSYGNSPGQMMSPTAIAVSSTGQVYVSGEWGLAWRPAGVALGGSAACSQQARCAGAS